MLPSITFAFEKPETIYGNEKKRRERTGFKFLDLKLI